jgi:hypothetical protein
MRTRFSKTRRLGKGWYVYVEIDLCEWGVVFSTMTSFDKYAPGEWWINFHFGIKALCFSAAIYRLGGPF